jgi:thiol-disulfide isomerase/thioredoxin
VLRPRHAAVSAALIAVVALAGCGSEKAAGNGPSGGTTNQNTNTGLTRYAAADRKPAPKLEGGTVDDQQFSLAAQKGKVVVVNFWGSWCPPCRAESPDLVTVHGATSSKGVVFVGVDERDSKTNARSYQKTYGVTYPSVFDEDGSVAALWPSAAGPPYTFIIDKQGRVAARFLGGVTTMDLQPEVMRVVGEA